MGENKIKISSFCLTTNNIKYQFPFIESIKSFLPVIDEMIIVDGGSTDGTVEAIQAIGDNKIRIIQDEDTKWEDEWLYWRMGHNFNRGVQECTGDWILKFDTDYILHEKGSLKSRHYFEDGIKRRKLTMGFTRINHILANKYFIKTRKTLAVNKVLCNEVGINLKYGFDLDNWGWGFEFIDGKRYENNIHFGDLLGSRGESNTSSLLIHNYDNIFSDKKAIKEMRSRHWLAEEKQRAIVGKYKFNRIDNSWNNYKKMCIANLSKLEYDIELEKHPKIIQDKIKNIKPEQQGYNCFGWNK